MKEIHPRRPTLGEGVALAAALLMLSGCKPSGDRPSEEKTNLLIQPVAKVELAAQPAAAATSAPAATAAPPAASARPAASPAAPSAPTAPSAGGGAGGKALYDTVCMACHLPGVAGAPKLGDKAAWAPRLPAGIDALTKSVIAGKGAMPPKAGNNALSDAEIRAAVEYMVAQSK